MTKHETPNSEKTSRFGANRAVAAGLAVGVLGGTAAGLVFGVPGLSNAAGTVGIAPAAVVQQTDTTDPVAPAAAPTAPDDPWTPGHAPEPARPRTRLRVSLQPLVDAGTITAAQVDAVVAQLQSSMPMRADGEGRGPGGRDARSGRGAGVFGRAADPRVLTTLLGLNGAELMTQLRDGSTLAEIATAHGVEPQAVVDALVAEAKTHLDQAVIDGRIDQSEADQKLVDAMSRIAAMVDHGRPDRSADHQHGD